jgi:Lrp/AsnC family transcriptional regulator, regulator for asnA, asnC and gidA
MVARALDHLDRRIVALVQEDGRIPNLEMARQLGVTEGTVRKRLERLIADGFVRVTAVADPTMFGYHIHTMIGIQSEPGHGPEVAANLSTMPEVLAVYLTSGSYDLLVEAALPSNEELLAFLNERLGAIPGVRRSEAYHILKVLKRARDWQLPCQPVDPIPGVLASERA